MDLKFTNVFFNELANSIRMKPDYQDSKELATISYYDKLNKNDYYQVDEKFNLMEIGKSFEKSNPRSAINFYNELKDNELFANDYYPYRRIGIVCKKNKMYNDDLVNILSFFNRDTKVYCNNHQYLWFYNKILELKKLLDIPADCMDLIHEQVNYFNNNKMHYKTSQNIPSPIAERIRKDKNEICVIKQEKYDFIQTIYEIEEYEIGFERRKDYSKAIDCCFNILFNNNLLYLQYYALHRLALIYERIPNKNLFIECCNKYSNQLNGFITKNIEVHSNTSDDSFYQSTATIQSDNIYQSEDEFSEKVEKQIEEIERDENLELDEVEDNIFRFIGAFKVQWYHLDDEENLILDDEETDYSDVSLEEACEHVKDYEDWSYYTITNNYIYFRDGSVEKRYTEDEVYEIYSNSIN